ncbi:MAG: hydroxysqualene dehydroxylase HpnE [Gammaproteobacteria bacterium]|nr:FAD-dependent oxidoreductase [Sideroxydans sp.]MBU4044715.1 hydroxysqualene dehydroxylase HpnE [Gammaproteobacteria bacterium]MBU4150605.1 hydroxysqualene dehydroxylase HpnE [Gammaproteobacteria bacterium]
MAAELKVGIIGGGYAGMAAAAELAAAGIPVTVFESAKQLGGRARGVAYHDTQLDNGQHLLLGCYRETLRLIELVGGDIERDFLRLPLQLDLHQHLELRAPRLPAPLHLLFALLNAKGLSWRERIKAAHFMLALRAMDFCLPQDMTVAELLKQHGQDAGLTLKFWEPLTIAALNTPISKASAQVLLNVLRDALNRKRADSDMLLPRLDFTALFPQRAAAFIERHGGRVQLSCGVDTIIPDSDGIALQTAQGTQRFSHVICAASPAAAERLLRHLPELAETVRQIAALEQQPIYTVYLQYPAQVRLPHPMIGLHQRFSQWLFDKGSIAGQHGLLAAVISAEGIHQQLDQEALAEKVVVELREEFGITTAPLWRKVIAEKRATFCCAPNLKRPAQQTTLPRLLLAGDYTAGDYPATLEGAVLSGVHCARRCLPGRK